MFISSLSYLDRLSIVFELFSSVTCMFLNIITIFACRRCNICSITMKIKKIHVLYQFKKWRFAFFKVVPNNLSATRTWKNILWMWLWRQQNYTSKKGNNSRWKWPSDNVLRHIIAKWSVMSNLFLKIRSETIHGTKNFRWNNALRLPKCHF